MTSQYQPLDRCGDSSIKPECHGGDDVFVEKSVDKNLFLVHPSEGYKEGEQVMVWNQAYRYMTQPTQSP